MLQLHTLPSSGRCACSATARTVPFTVHRVPQLHAFAQRSDASTSCRGVQLICGAAKTAATSKGFGAQKPQPKPAVVPDAPCPCGSGKAFAACCSPFHEGAAVPATPEQLLRSRYTAYALKQAPYIADTTSLESKEFTGTRAVYLQSVKATMKRAEWQGLEIMSQEPGATPDEAFINFRAFYVDVATPETIKAGKQCRTERSQFVRDPKTKRWTYMGSEMVKAEEPAPFTLSLPQIKL